MRHLGDAGLRTRRIMRFELACPRELGLMPVLHRCAQCGEAVEFAAVPVLFGVVCGGVVCSRCGPGARDVAWLSMTGLNTMKVLRLGNSRGREMTCGAD